MTAFGSFESSDGPAPLLGRGEALPFKTDLCEGQLCFVHRPREDDNWEPPQFVRDLLKISGPPDACWEMQVQIRFREQPKGPVFVGFECRDGPLQLGVISRAFAKGALSFGQSMAKARGAEVRYTLGDAPRGIRPHIAIPVTAFLRMFRSTEPVPLPIMHAEQSGTWQWSEGAWEPIQREEVFDTEHFYTCVFNAANIDWHLWSLVGIPVVGSLSLTRLMGTQALYAVLYDDGRASPAGPADDPAALARPFLQVEFTPPQARAALKAQPACSEASTAEELEANVDAFNSPSSSPQAEASPTS